MAGAAMTTGESALKKAGELIKEAIDDAIIMLEKVEDFLPEPCATPVKAIIQGLKVLSNALGLDAYLDDLMARCCSLVGLITGKLPDKTGQHPAQLAAGGTTGQPPPPGQPPAQPAQAKEQLDKPAAEGTLAEAYSPILDRFKKVLEEMIELAEKRRPTNPTVVHVIKSAGRRLRDALTDNRVIMELDTRISMLMVEAEFAITVDMRNMTKEIEALLTEMALRVEDLDDGKPLREYVKAKGGLDVILNSPNLVVEALKQLDPAHRLVTEVILVELREKGVHTNIPQPQLRSLWYKQFQNQTEVEWSIFWGTFPSGLQGSLPQAEFEQLSGALARDEDQQTFEAFMSEDGFSPAHKLQLSKVVSVFNKSTPLVEQVEAILQTRPQRRGGATCALPSVGPAFLGREEDVERLCGLFSDSRRAVCVVGEGGLGKSSVALAVGWRLWEQRTVAGGAAFVSLRGATTLQQQERRLCEALDITGKDDEERRTLLMARLARQDASQRLLLLLDNAEDCFATPDAATFGKLLEQVINTSPGVLLLITSRLAWPASLPALPGLQPGQSHGLQPLAFQAVQDLVRRLWPLKQAPMREDVSKIATACNGTPLLTRLVTPAFAYGRLSLQDLEETAPEARLGFVMQALDREVQLQVARLSVFPLAFAEDDACAVLRTTTKEAATLLSELYGHGLVQFNTVANGYVMHLSIRQQAAALPLAGSSTIAQSQVALVRHMAEQVARWTRQFITPAANLAVSLAKKNARNLEEAWRLVLAVPGVQQECWLQMASNMDGGLDVLYAAGVPMPSDRAWADLYKQVVGAAAALKMAEAETLSYQGQEPDAVALHREALELRHRVLGPEHLDTATSKNSLAMCFEALGKHTAAEPLLREALALRNGVLGPEHPDTITSKDCLATCLNSQHRFAEAEPMYREALELRRRPEVWGERHPGTIASINNLAVCLSRQGKHAEAERLQQAALDLCTEVLGPEHPDTICNLGNLAGCLGAQGQHAAAEPRLRKALELRRKVLGHLHPDTISNFGALMACLHAQGKHAVAEPLLREELELRRKELGPKHPLTIAAQQALGRCLRAKAYQALVPRRRLLLFLLCLLVAVLSVCLARRSSPRLSAVPA